MTARIATVIDRLARIHGVEEALVVDPDAGVPVTGQAAAGGRSRALAALAASLHKRAARAAAGHGTADRIELLHLEGERGHLLVGPLEGLLLVARTAEGAHLGLVRIELEHAARAGR